MELGLFPSQAGARALLLEWGSGCCGAVDPVSPGVRLMVLRTPRSRAAAQATCAAPPAASCGAGPRGSVMG